MEISLLNNIKYKLGILAAAGTLAYAQPAQAQRVDLTQKPDTFIRTTNPVDKYTSEDLPKIFREPVNPSSWTNDPKILKTAPDPYFTLKGKKTLAKGVVDITNCRLYIYDNDGKAIEAYRVATGAPSSKTQPGIRKVLKKQVYPYLDCDKSTKRRRFPFDYGPKIAYMNIVDTITGKMWDNGDYVHGTRHEFLSLKNIEIKYFDGFAHGVILFPKHNTLYITHSCVRLPNRDALYLITNVLKVGDFFKYIKR